MSGNKQDMDGSGSNVVTVGSGSGSHLATIDLYRRADGEIDAVLSHMPVPVIEAEPTITARFTKAAMWMLSGSLSMMRQAVRFDDEAREAANEDEGAPDNVG